MILAGTLVSPEAVMGLSALNLLSWLFIVSYVGCAGLIAMRRYRQIKSWM